MQFIYLLFYFITIVYTAMGQSIKIIPKTRIEYWEMNIKILKDDLTGKKEES